MDHIDRVGENIIRKHLTRISKEFHQTTRGHRESDHETAGQLERVSLLAASRNALYLLQPELARLGITPKTVLDEPEFSVLAEPVALDRALNVPPRTVETHRANLFAKLEAESLAQLIRQYAGLVEGDC